MTTHCYQVNFCPVMYGSLSIFWLTVGHICTTTSITHCFLEGVSNKTVFLVQKLPGNIKTDFYLQTSQLLSTLQKVALIFWGQTYAQSICIRIFNLSGRLFYYCPEVPTWPKLYNSCSQMRLIKVIFDRKWYRTATAPFQFLQPLV